MTVGERTDGDTRQVARRRRGGLVRYVVAAALVRGADSGAAVGLILLAVDPASHLRNGAATGGLLAATLSAPHLVGPWTAHRLDRARDGRWMLAGAYLIYAVALAAGATAVGRVPIAAAVGAVAVAGCCGPLLTGGLSSRLAAIAQPAVRAQRRAQGWDALTYSVGGTAGPAMVAGLSVAFTATLAARTKYAPPYARAQVFVTSAGLKVALASVGAAVTGMAAGLGGRALLLIAAAITATSVLAAGADRVFGR